MKLEFRVKQQQNGDPKQRYNVDRMGGFSHSQATHLHHNYVPFIAIQWTTMKDGCKECFGIIYIRMDIKSSTTKKFRHFFPSIK